MRRVLLVALCASCGPLIGIDDIERGSGGAAGMGGGGAAGIGGASGGSGGSAGAGPVAEPCAGLGGLEPGAPWPMFRRCPSGSGRSRFRGPDGPAMRWSKTLAPYPFASTGPASDGVVSSPAIAADGTIFVGTASALAALSPQGELLWSFATGAVVDASPAIAADGTVVFGALDGRVHGVSQSGEPRFEYVTGGPVASSAVIAEDGTILVGSDDGKLHAIGPDGAPRWTYAAGGAIRTAPAIAPDGTIVVAAPDGVHAVTAAGKLVWKAASTSALLASPMLDASARVVAGASLLRAYDVATGAVAWSLPLATPPRGSASLFEGGDVLVPATPSLRVSPSGDVVWSKQPPAMPWSSAAVDAQGRAYLSAGFAIYALGDAGGTLWQAQGGVMTSSPAIGADGALYVSAVVSGNTTVIVLGP